MDSVLGPVVAMPASMEQIDLSNTPNWLAREKLFVIPTDFIHRKLTTAPSNVLQHRTTKLYRHKRRVVPFLFSVQNITDLAYMHKILPNFVFVDQPESEVNEATEN